MKRAYDRETAIRAVLHPLAQRRPLAISPTPLRVAEYIVSIDVTRVRLPAEESGDQWLCCVTAEMFKISWSIKYLQPMSKFVSHNIDDLLDALIACS